jgi:hypothetical protein
MKLLICIVLLFTQFGYGQNFNPFKKKITINFSSGFNNCYVKFSLNEKTIFEDTIDTEWSTGLAHSMDIYVPRSCCSRCSAGHLELEIMYPECSGSEPDLMQIPPH